MAQSSGQSESSTASQPDAISQMCQEAQKVLLQATKAANGFPLDEYDYFNSFREFSKLMDKNCRNISFMIDSLLQKHLNKERPFSKATDDVERFQVIIDANDVLIDKVCNAFDEVEGLKRKNEELVVATLKKPMYDSSSGKSKATTSSDITLLTAKIVERPQVHFSDKIDNSHNPFIPKISEKPNSIKPLALLPEEIDGYVTYPHPYELEIEKFQPSRDRELKPAEPQVPPQIENTPFTYVDSIDVLNQMMSHLKSTAEMAVDLEHHHFRSFQGFTCLIQISTRTQDFVIDALKLRSHLNCLNEVFTDPRILKVFHGADSDIVWLQRDFGVYVVNLFDTFQASKVIGLAHHSLAHLLKSYCRIECDKQYQLADWRIRPLSQEMVLYARQDTHYLLYLYDLMKNHLIEKSSGSLNLLQSVFVRSSAVCLKKYEKPQLTPTSHLSLIARNGISLNSRQLYALEKLYEWRDKIAREQDESYGFVLPNHMLLQICQILPREMQGILACCNPVPPLVKQNINELHQIILKSREQMLTKLSDKRKSVGPIGPSLSNPFAKHDLLVNEAEIHPLLDSSLDATHDSKDTSSNSRKHQNSKLMTFMLPQCSRKRDTANSICNITCPYDRYVQAVKSNSNSNGNNDQS